MYETVLGTFSAQNPMNFAILNQPKKYSIFILPSPRNIKLYFPATLLKKFVLKHSTIYHSNFSIPLSHFISYVATLFLYKLFVFPFSIFFYKYKFVIFHFFKKIKIKNPTQPFYIIHSNPFFYINYSFFHFLQNTDTSFFIFFSFSLIS